jgi:hypothetical protein
LIGYREHPVLIVNDKDREKLWRPWSRVRSHLRDDGRRATPSSFYRLEMFCPSLTCCRQIGSLRSHQIAESGGRALEPGLIMATFLVVPPVLIAVPPAAARTLTVPSPEAAFGASWSTSDPALAAHVVPSVLVASADEGGNRCCKGLRLRCVAGARHCHARGGPKDRKSACRN